MCRACQGRRGRPGSRGEGKAIVSCVMTCKDPAEDHEFGKRGEKTSSTLLATERYSPRHSLDRREGLTRGFFEGR